MQKTTNYEIFKVHENNRKIDECSLRKLKLSLQTRNMLHLKPIIVNSNFEVIDGQHRLQAAKELLLEVYYEIDHQNNLDDIILLNANQKNWTLEDYLNFYCNKGIEPYLKIRDLTTTYDLSISNCAAIFSASPERHSHQIKFKSGLLKLNMEDFSEAENKIKCLCRIRKFLDERLLYKQKYYRAPYFTKAYLQFISNSEYDESVFFKKIEQKIDAFHSCSTVSGYYEMFKQIYNFRNSDPIA